MKSITATIMNSVRVFLLLAGVLAAQSGHTQTCFPTPSRIVSWWRAESNTLDSVSANNGVLENGATYSSGAVGEAFFFGGGNAHMRVTNASNLCFSNAITIECWIYPTNITSDHQIVSKWDAVGGINQRSYGTSIGSDGKPYFCISTNGYDSGATVVFSTTAITNNQWTHLAATYDGSTLKMYLNGSLNNTTAWSGNIFAGTDDLGIGGVVGGEPNGSVILPFLGAIDEVAVYNRALLECEIEAIYSAGSAGKCP